MDCTMPAPLYGCIIMPWVEQLFLTRFINCGWHLWGRSVMEGNKFESNILFVGRIKAGSNPPGWRQLSFSTFHACMRKVFAPNESRVKRKEATAIATVSVSVMAMARAKLNWAHSWVISRKVESTAGSSLNTSNFFFSQFCVNDVRVVVKHLSSQSTISRIKIEASLSRFSPANAITW